MKAGKKVFPNKFTYRYIDDVLSLNNSKFSEYLEFIYPPELENEETSETIISSSYLDLYLYINNRKLTATLYDKWDDFNFPIINFPFLSNNPASILYKSITGRYRPVSYPDGPITARYRFIKNAYWE